MSQTHHSLQQQTSVDAVVQRLMAGPEPELARTIASVVRHLHLAVREVRPSQRDWRAAIEFVTEVGHACDERRQEWVLLSDLLGVTQLVEDINAHRPRGATPNTPRGPFYRSDSPKRQLGADICLDGKGERMAVRGQVCDLDGHPVPGASIETWQANGEGHYENQQPDLQPEFNLRGRFRADEHGLFYYDTVRPAGFKVPVDGPVGQLMAQLDYPLDRPAHLSFLITAPDFETISTQVYDRSDTAVSLDPVFGVRPELLADIRQATDGKGKTAWSLDYTFVMARARRTKR